MDVSPAIAALLVFAAIQAPTAELPRETLERLGGLLHESQQSWTEEELAAARAALVTDARGVVEFLVDQLDEPAVVDGLFGESTLYTVCGNALTLLEELTGERIDPCGREWIGFRTHDHRSLRPSAEEIEAPWRAWLAVRAEVPPARWFCGLSAQEIRPILALLDSAPASWGEKDWTALRELGPRAYPFLIEKVLDDEFSAGERVTDRANELLRRLTKKDAGELARHELLRYDPSDPMRALSTHLNRASMRLVHQRWIELMVR